VSDDLRLEHAGAISIVTIDRPAKRNAFNLAMWESVPAVVAAASSGGARVVVLRGRPGGDFSAGADISEFNTLRNDLTSAEHYSQVVHRAVTAVADLHIPTVAMIDGYCVGGGCELVLACDIRVATENAMLGITPAKLGIVYSLSSTRRLVSAVGPAMSRYLLLTANLIGARRAFEIGLVHEIYTPDEYETAGLALAERLSKLAAVSHAGSRAIISRIERGLVDEDAEVGELYRASFLSPEYREGVAAFTQGRSPDFANAR
jgi:enoyl-CoA hydratase/carnithine racemase